MFKKLKLFFLFRNRKMKAKLSGGYQLYKLKQSLHKEGITLDKNNADITFSCILLGNMVSCEAPNPDFWNIPYACNILVTFQGDNKHLSVLEKLLSK